MDYGEAHALADTLRCFRGHEEVIFLCRWRRCADGFSRVYVRVRIIVAVLPTTTRRSPVARVLAVGSMVLLSWRYDRASQLTCTAKRDNFRAC